MTVFPKDKNGNIVLNNSPFNSKRIKEGNLFKRYWGMGNIALAPNETGDIEFMIPYAWCKLEGIEILGQTKPVQIDFFIEDSEAGLYSGTGISRFSLNQFGFEYYAPATYFEKKSSFDADLYQGMWIVLQITNISDVTQIIFSNIELNEVKP